MNSKDFVKKILGFSLASWISFAVSFMTVPITTRIYSPEQLGHINIFSSIASLCLLIVLFGLDQAFIRFYNEPPKGSLKELFKNCLLIVGILFLGFIIIAIIFRKEISFEITGTYQPLIVLLLLINIFAMIVLRFSSLIYRMDQKVLAFSIQALILMFSNKLLYVLTGFIQPNYMLALTAMNSATLVTAVSYIFLQREFFSLQKFHMDLHISKMSLKFAMPLMPITIISWVNTSVSIMLMRHYLDFNAIGIYSSGVAIASLIGIIGSGFNLFWIPYVYANYKTDMRRIQSVHRYLTFILIFAAITIFLFQDIIFLLIGPKYLGSKVFFSFLIIAPICSIISDTTGLGIDISKKSYLHLISTSLSALVNIVFCVILLPILGLKGAAIASASAGITLLIARTIIGEKYYKCVDNYTASIAALIILIIGSTTSFLWNNLFFVRSVIGIALLIILILMYNKEFIRIASDAYKIATEQISFRKGRMQDD